MTRALAILETTSAVKVDLGEPVAFLRAPDGSLWATSAALALWLGFSNRQNFLGLARKHADEVAPFRNSVRLHTEQGEREAVVYSEAGALVLLLLAGTEKGALLRRTLAERAVNDRRAREAAKREKKLGPIERAQGVLVDAQGEIEQIQERAEDRDARDALADVLVDLEQSAEVLEVYRSGRLRRGVSLPFGGRQIDRSKAGADAAREEAAGRFARLLGAASRKPIGRGDA